jgi:hypothetical protein
MAICSEERRTGRGGVSTPTVVVYDDIIGGACLRQWRDRHAPRSRLTAGVFARRPQRQRNAQAVRPAGPGSICGSVKASM